MDILLSQLLLKDWGQIVKPTRKKFLALLLLCNHSKQKKKHYNWPMQHNYGLAATIWTQDISKANRVAAKVESGIIWVNCWLLRDLRTPFGGMKNSGVGREGGWEALRFFTEAKNVCIEL